MPTDFPNADIIRVLSTSRTAVPQVELIPEHCVICGERIQTMVWKGTGVCGDNHRKKRDKIENEERAISP